MEKYGKAKIITMTNLFLIWQPGEVMHGLVEL